jgi:hypothetical protein
MQKIVIFVKEFGAMQTALIQNLETISLFVFGLDRMCYELPILLHHKNRFERNS